MTIDPSMRLKPGPKPGRGGRPSIHKGDPLEVVIWISHDLREIIELEARPKERLSDTLLRLVRERNFVMQGNPKK